MGVELVIASWRKFDTSRRTEHKGELLRIVLANKIRFQYLMYCSLPVVVSPTNTSIEIINYTLNLFFHQTQK